MEEDSPKKEKEQEDKEVVSRRGKEFYWILGVMVSLILVFIVSQSIFQSTKTFEYQGLSFTKDKFGEIPLFRYSYYYTPSPITGSVVNPNPKQINLFLRGDPRLNTVPVDGEIEFPESTDSVTISINSTGLNKCEYTSPALSSLTLFIAENGFQVKGAVPDEVEAAENKIPFANCESQPSSMVIIAQEGTETKIERRDNCYIIDIANCEALPAVEKFMIQAIIDAKARAIS